MTTNWLLCFQLFTMPKVCDHLDWWWKFNPNACALRKTRLIEIWRRHLLTSTNYETWLSILQKGMMKWYLMGMLLLLDVAKDKWFFFFSFKDKYKLLLTLPSVSIRLSGTTVLRWGVLLAHDNTHIQLSGTGIWSWV